MEQQHIITTGAQLNKTDKEKLKNELNVIHGKYVDNWGPECTHLTVNDITITIKFLHALVDEKPIVVKDYWAKFSKNVLKNKPPPAVENYNKPVIKDPLLNINTILKKVCRKTIFEGKIFIFPSTKSKLQMESIITKTG